MGAERVSYPVADGPVVWPCYGYDVKSAAVESQPGIGQDECLSGRDDLALLTPIDGTQCPTKGAAAAKADFDEHQRFTIEHNQVNFAEFSTEISDQEFETLLTQKLQRGVFGPVTCESGGEFQPERSVADGWQSLQ